MTEMPHCLLFLMYSAHVKYSNSFVLFKKSNILIYSEVSIAQYRYYVDVEY
jgi:hypothetical protein